MNDKIALIIQPPGSHYLFEVRCMDSFGDQRVLASGWELQDVLLAAANSAGHPLVLPISGPNTTL